MLFMMNKAANKTKQGETVPAERMARIKELFGAGKFPVVTTECIEGKAIDKVLGLVACRGYDSDEAFFGMTARAVNKGAQGIIGYQENIAFHPDGSKFFSCYGTAVQFVRSRRSLSAPADETARSGSFNANA